jgi:hypothetical protein
MRRRTLTADGASPDGPGPDPRVLGGPGVAVGAPGMVRTEAMIRYLLLAWRWRRLRRRITLWRRIRSTIR